MDISTGHIVLVGHALLLLKEVDVCKKKLKQKESKNSVFYQTFLYICIEARDHKLIQQ